ncbi:MAG: DUF3048 domain-containing protein [Actinomycetota bacterium]
MRSSRTLVVVVVLCALVIAACSDDDSPSANVGEPAEQAAEKEEPVCPLTGEEVPRGVEVERAAVAVKIENSREARPQSGLEDADLVYEEIVEGGITRFMAIFHCGDSERAGPVRSARFDDPKIALAFTRIIGYSGANSIVEGELRQNKMAAINELNGGDAFFRIPPGTLEIHNLFADVSKVRAEAPRSKRKAPRRGVFEFGEPPPDAKKVRSVTVHFTASNSIEYRWKGGEWKRWEAGEPFMTKAGAQIGVPNVVVQQVEVDNSRKIVDPAGNPSPDISLEGRGKAWLFRDGRVLKGEWKIAKAGRPALFTTRGGKPFSFDVGAIWVELVPSSKGEVKGSVTVR